MDILEERLEQIVKQVEKRQEELIELVTTLVRFKTPAPPARNTAENQQFIADYLKELGFEIDMWEVYPNDPNLVGIKKGKQSDLFNRLILNGHIDVAEIREDENWLTAPFDPVISDGKIIGRGVADMKGGLSCVLFALKLLHEANIDINGDLIFQSVVGEEVGEAGTLQCYERGYDADFALVVDTSDLHIQGQGGVITGWITIKGSETYHDATRRKMIHAGGGLFAASAIEKMMKMIEGLQELERHWAVTKHYEKLPPGANTINPAFIEGGRHPAFIADECKLWITVHYYPNETDEEVCKEIEDHLFSIAKADPWLKDHLPIIEWGGRSMIEEKGEIFPALEVNPDHSAIQLLAKTHKKTHGKEVTIDVSPTVTDGGWFGKVGIPAAIYGPGDLQNAHAVNESCSIEQLIQFTQTMIRFIYVWTNMKKDERLNRDDVEK